MKKIGILTFHHTTNYGAVLQALALEKKIQELGGNCEIINYKCENIEQREFYCFPKFNANIINYLKRIRYYFKCWSKRKVIKAFIKKNLVISKKIYSKKTIPLANSDYEKFVVGSDMVWELGITNYDISYYLDFADVNKRYSYAASLGVEKIDSQYLDRCVDCLSKFQHISVRENQTRDYLKKVLKKDVYVDVDPTLLHDGSFWKKYEDVPRVKPSNKYILLYFLDNNGIMLNTAKQIADKQGYEIVLLSNSKCYIPGVKVINNASVGEFLYYIHYADLVITGSYHGMIFSMNYNTNFMYYNRANSTRMESIAEITSSSDRRLKENNIPSLNCDFKKINRAVNVARERSLNYLKSIIKK